MGQQFPVSSLPGLLGGLEKGLPSAVVTLTNANTVYEITAGMTLTDRKLLAFYNPNAVTVYYNDKNNVTTANGFPCAPGQTIALEFFKGKAFKIYAVCGTAGQTLNVSEGG